MDGAYWQLEMGEKVALVGLNGSGKTTLLKIIAGTLSPDSGYVRVDPGIRIGYVPQEARFDGSKTLKEEICDRDDSNIRRSHRGASVPSDLTLIFSCFYI